MNDVKTATVTIKTSPRFGSNHCAEDCPHFVLHVKFPPQPICKICGPLEEPDTHNRFPRKAACRYLFGEEVDERFWSPMREQLG
jgi:hypothetical protein